MGLRSESRDRTLDAFRGLMIVFVVFIHAFPYLGLAVDSGWAAVVWRIVSTIAVPGFFLADGILFARTACDPGRGLADRLARSARRLLVPWLLFAIAYTALRLTAEARGLLAPAAPPPASFADFARAIWASTYATSLYFLPALFLVRAAAALLRPLLADGRIIAAVGLVWPFVYKAVIEPAYLDAVKPIGMDPVIHAIWGFGFFALGWALAIWWERLGRPAVVAAALVLGAASFAPLPPVFGSVAFQFGYLLAAYAAIDALSGRGLGPAAALGRRTMGIYLLHAPLVMKALQIVIVGVADPQSPAALFGLALGSLIVAALMTEAVTRLRLGWLLFGETGRVRPTPVLPG